MRRCLAVRKRDGRPCESNRVPRGASYCPMHQKMRDGVPYLPTRRPRAPFLSPPVLVDQASAVRWVQWFAKQTVRKDLKPRQLHLLRESFKDWCSLSGIALRVPKAPRPTKARPTTPAYTLTPDDLQPE